MTTDIYYGPSRLLPMPSGKTIRLTVSFNLPIAGLHDEPERVLQEARRLAADEAAGFIQQIIINGLPD